MSEEFVDVVDENDEVVGNVEKQEVYLRGLPNRIVHVFVIHPENGTVFIQRRSASIRYLPNFLCTSAGGHVSAGETYESAAARELEEELGLVGDLILIDKFTYNCPENIPTKRFITLFVHYAKDGITYSDGEVSDGFFVTLEKLEELILKNKEIHPQLPVCLESYLKFLKKN